MASECRSSQQRRGTHLERDANGDLVLVGEERELVAADFSAEWELCARPDDDQAEGFDQ